MKLTSNITTDWKPVIEDYLKNNLPNLEENIIKEYQNKLVFPEFENIFKCFSFFNIKDTKVVLLGQDPYHNYGEAMGLSFSVNQGVKIPSSLRNMFKELKTDLGIDRTNTDLTDWAQQGVLLLNTFLTVLLNEPKAHAKLGWEQLTDYIIQYVDQNVPGVIFILMGNDAKKKMSLIKNSKNIIATVHPSGLSASRGFYGSKIYSRTNELLKQQNKKEIKW